MFRVRRYRIFLGIAILTVVGLFFLGDSSLGTDYAYSTYDHVRGKQEEEAQQKYNVPEAAAGLGEALSRQQEDHLVKGSAKNEVEDDFPQINIPGDDDKPAIPKNAVPDRDPAKLKADKLAQETAAAAPAGDQPARLDLSPSASFVYSTPSPLYWSKSPEHYPVPSASIIPLPSGKPKDIPRVQPTYRPETAVDRRPRIEKQEDIKATFLKHWQGYKKFAWQHDELLPVSGGFKDPFAGWRATLVDSMDTLWIMGLKQEFEEAVDAVKTIDFTTTKKDSLPVFEVVIRYLGGLLAANDLSDGKYPILKEKAQQLGEVMLSAFDTPNRMPITHFHWQPSYRAIPRVATSSAVLAEVGSLCMEFTRLAQGTKEDKYYDAVARITNNFYDWQNNTHVPGLWPLYLDETGGCLVPPSPGPPKPQPISNSPWGGAEKAASYQRGGPSDPRRGKDSSSFGIDRNNPAADKPDSGSWQDAELLLAENQKSSFATDEPDIKKAAPPISRTRQRLEDREARLAAKEGTANQKRQAATPTTNTVEDTIDCAKAGFTSSHGVDKYRIGVMADSAYEYLPKQWLLLGGLNDQYRTMHETAMAAVEKYLLYRPMIEDSQRKLLFTGAITTDGTIDQATGKITGGFDPETGHLSCFTGAYIGLGAKTFDRPKDMEMAKQLTDACVWAYEETASGIMPETFSPVPCDFLDGPCPWNETKWHEGIDPAAPWRIALNIKNNNARLEYERTASHAATHTAISLGGAATNIVKKRSPPTRAQQVYPVSTEPDPTTLPEYFKQRIKDDRLTPGVSRIGSRNYILRPEAIESVFYMYRLTGDQEWRDKGWAMWKAVKKGTDSKYGNSAVHDVTVAETALKDNAESFWTGETLKYFYLLFSEESLISLDEWVLNTEAHPFRRADAPAKT